MTKANVGWHPLDITTALRKRYGDVTKLSVEWGYGSTAISEVVHHAGRSARVEMLVAQALGVTPHAIWPLRWTSDGRPIRPSTPVQTRKRIELGTQRQKGAVA